MKVALVVHGAPPELVGGTELAVQGLARGLARRGHRVLVIAGSMDHAAGFRVSRALDVDPVSGAKIDVVRIHRADLFFDHWQKSASGQVARAFEALLDEERVDLVHVHHWIRLSDDLVARAAKRGVPSCVTLHDLWTSCLVAFRVRTGTQEFCEAPLAADPCLACAAGLPPRTPWLGAASQAERLERRRATIRRELSLARVVMVPTRAHGEAIRKYLGISGATDALRVVPHGRDLDLVKRAALPAPREHGRLELASWAHLHPLKGQDLLLAALKRMPSSRPVRLHLLGDEVDAAFARALHTAARGLDVVFHGPFEVAALDAHAGTRVHAMVSGSRAFESWGLVLDEAVALGLPSILPRSGAFPERMPSGALFYAPGDPADLARVLGTLFEPDAWEHLRAGVPPLASIAPSMDAHVEEVLAAYQQTCEKGAALGPANTGDLADAEVSVNIEDTRAMDLWEGEWDRSLTASKPSELGFEEGPSTGDCPDADE